MDNNKYGCETFRKIENLRNCYEKQFSFTEKSCIQIEEYEEKRQKIIDKFKLLIVPGNDFNDTIKNEIIKTHNELQEEYILFVKEIYDVYKDMKDLYNFLGDKIEDGVEDPCNIQYVIKVLSSYKEILGIFSNEVKEKIKETIRRSENEKKRLAESMAVNRIISTDDDL